MSMALRLHESITAVCPISGSRIGRRNDRATWSFDAAPEATAEQVAAGHAALAAFDASPEAQAAWEEDQHPRRKALRQAAQAALDANDAYLLVPTPTAAQVREQVERLTRQTQHIIRRLVEV